MATYYWVGGAGTWNNSSTTNWASSTGGAGNAGVPNNADTAIFDSNSGTGDVSVATTAVSLSTTLNSATINLNLTGSPTLCTTTGTFTFTQGTITLNSFTLTCGRFSSVNSNTRTIAFGTGNITLTGNAATIWTLATATGFNLTGTPVVNCTYSGATGTRTINAGGNATITEANTISFNITAGTDIVAIGTSQSVKNINFSGFAGTLNNASNFTVYGNYTLSTGITLIAGTGATTFAATSGTQQITTNGKNLDFPITQNGIGGTVQLQDNLTMGSTRTFTLTAGTLDLSSRTLSTGLFSSSNSNIRTIAFGTGNITLTGNAATIWTNTTATNFTVSGTPTVNSTYAGSTGTRTINGPGGATASEASTLNFNISAGSDTVTLQNRCFRNLDFTGFTGTLTNSSRSIFGNLTVSSGMTLGSGTLATTFAATSGTQQITTNGKTLDFQLIFDGVGGTFAFQDALIQGSTQEFRHTNGTISLKNGVISTVGLFITLGTNQKFLQSTTPGSQATLSQASGTVNASYLTIRDINAVGGAEWDAFVNQQNIDAGNNDGWDFGISPIVGSYEYTYQLRSFTQPRRF